MFSPLPDIGFTNVEKPQRVWRLTWKCICGVSTFARSQRCIIHRWACEWKKQVSLKSWRVIVRPDRRLKANLTFYLIGRPPHWTASKGHWSGNGIWWRWLCGPQGARWQSGRLDSRGQRTASESPDWPPTPSLSGSNRWPAWTSSPLDWTCCCSVPVEMTGDQAWKHD